MRENSFGVVTLRYCVIFFLRFVRNKEENRINSTFHSILKRYFMWHDFKRNLLKIELINSTKWHIYIIDVELPYYQWF